MIKEFELSDGRKGSIDLDDNLIEIFGEAWAEQMVAEAIAKFENKSESQE